MQCGLVNEGGRLRVKAEGTFPVSQWSRRKILMKGISTAGFTTEPTTSVVVCRWRLVTTGGSVLSRPPKVPADWAVGKEGGDSGVRWSQKDVHVTLYVKERERERESTFNRGGGAHLMVCLWNDPRILWGLKIFSPLQLFSDLWFRVLKEDQSLLYELREHN